VGIVIAEDDMELRTLLVSLLRREGFDVVAVPDGAAVLEYAAAAAEGRAPPVDLFVMDVRMPGLSGLEVVSALRKSGCDAPIVLMTAFGDQTFHARASAAGANAVLDKPFGFDELCRKVRRLVCP
jgi:two-component system response regulator (stage 0 sporulation protein F)